MRLAYNDTRLPSLPIRGRGLKQTSFFQNRVQAQVAPYTGAWIETLRNFTSYPNWLVAPYTGAWIETQNFMASLSMSTASLPIRGRGLKQIVIQNFLGKILSLPIRGRGLKPYILNLSKRNSTSLPIRGRGLKLSTISNARGCATVAPYTGACGLKPGHTEPGGQRGAWIETHKRSSQL